MYKFTSNKNSPLTWLSLLFNIENDGCLPFKLSEILKLNSSSKYRILFDPSQIATWTDIMKLIILKGVTVIVYVVIYSRLIDNLSRELKLREIHFILKPFHFLICLYRCIILLKNNFLIDSQRTQKDSQ